MKAHNTLFILLIGIASATQAATNDTISTEKTNSFINKLGFATLIQTDYDYFEGFYNEGKTQDLSNSHAFNLRRVRFSPSYEFSKNLSAKVGLEFNDNEDEVDINSAYLRYRGLKSMTLTLGKVKQPYGLEIYTSARNIMLTERSLVSNVLYEGKDYGLVLNANNKASTWSLGLFNQTKNRDNTIYALTGRYTLNPINTSDNWLQFGLNFSLKDWNSNSFKINESIQSNNTQKIFKSETVAANHLFQRGIDFVWQHKKWLLQSELHYQTVDIDNAAMPLQSNYTQLNIDQLTYWGYYAQASYAFGALKHSYNNGVLGNTKINVQPGIELISRYGYFDANHEGFGSRAKSLTLGANYYFNNAWRIMLNLTRSAQSPNGSQLAYANTMTVRAQYSF